jgi:O-antigen/teichoic acid export membrane protein
MKKNMGSLDRIIRLSIVALIAILYFTNVISGTWAIVLGVVAVVFLLTSLVGVCPLYMPFGISTKKKS